MKSIFILKNTSEENVVLRYNGQEKTVKPKETIDLLEFDVLTSELPFLEGRCLEKFGKQLKKASAKVVIPVSGSAPKEGKEKDKKD